MLTRRPGFEEYHLVKPLDWEEGLIFWSEKDAMERIKRFNAEGVVCEYLPPEEGRGDRAMRTGAIKFDSGKPRLDLLPVAALEQIAAVLAFGATRYGEHNWREGMKWGRVSGAALRHLFAWLRGEDKDPDSGLSHLAHAACNLCFLLDYVLSGKGEDDRYKAK